jgi:hypothetical protein
MTDEELPQLSFIFDELSIEVGAYHIPIIVGEMDNTCQCAVVEDELERVRLKTLLKVRPEY